MFSIQMKNYFAACKPKVVALMLFTALIGMLLASPFDLDIRTVLLALTGIGLVSASAASINQVVDRHIDAIMERTCRRPIPSGNLTTTQLSVFAGLVGTTGLVVLVLWVNLLTAALTAFSLIGYAWIYTRYLKYATPQNIVIGGAAGATPPLLGWIAVTNHIDNMALVLFLIIFVWTPPHFWALAICRKKEYAEANVPMLPVTHGEAFTRSQILLYSILLLPVTVLPFVIGFSGLGYLIAAIFVNGVMIFHAVVLKLRGGEANADKAFKVSISYLVLIFAALLVDRYAALIIFSSSL